MISISKLWSDGEFTHDGLRYGTDGTVRSAADRKPIVVWNATRTCNLKCIHCYSSSQNKRYEGELTFDEGRSLIDQLADFGVPTILFSGGEPLIRPDILDLIAYASSKGLRTVLSTNGTLLTREQAEKCKQMNLTYVGISLDGIGDVNDTFRRVPGAFEKTKRAFRICQEAGLKVGLRFTLTGYNHTSVNQIFDFLEENNIPRVCFYHLAYAGRGESIRGADVTKDETRTAIDTIIGRTEQFYEKGIHEDVLTVDNHCDGVYLYLRMLKINPERAQEIYRLLKWNGGGRYSSGVGIGCVDFTGNVHSDQFWQDYSFGNVKDRPFGDIWQDTTDPIMKGLKDRLPLLKGRCGKCTYKELCGGSLRARANAYYGDPWMEDPACYLTDEEIGIV